MFRPGGFDAVLLDMQMPGLGGAEAARQMRNREAGGAARAWMACLTGECTRQAAQCARESGMDACFAKPVHMAVLAAELAVHTKERGMDNFPEI